MNIIESALMLAAKGFRVFPVIPNQKEPAVSQFAEVATSDPDRVRGLFARQRNFNLGISTTNFGEGEALLVVDVDNKGAKKGDEEILRLEMQGLELPRTFTQGTPTGGTHLVYRTHVAVRQGTNVLAPGLDVRSHGGYVVGAGSAIDGRTYTVLDDAPVAEAPQWLIERCGVRTEKPKLASAPRALELTPNRLAQGLQYLRDVAPIAVQGSAGDQTTFQVAAHLKDIGFAQTEALALMIEFWNSRCQPPWSFDELKAKVENAYRYGLAPVGSAAPEREFEVVETETVAESLTPIDKLNQDFAFVTTGGGHHILWETTDQNGRFMLEHLGELTFHAKHKSWQHWDGKKLIPWTKLWMMSPKRREYRGLCFRPGLSTPDGWYNLWRGFAFEPAELGSDRAKRALAAFKEHALKNVCAGDESLYQWLMGYFAHMIQRPWEKPLTALVFRGKKGVGKNALVDSVGALLGSHYMLTAKQRYLVGNFNGHLENLVLLTLDEAFWSGDKSVDGILKDLVTGKHHVIERKGKEPYQVENCLRVVIMGNENWLVKATEDERRFAVFDVGEGRKQDNVFFQEMREGMEAGGYQLLLHYLQTFDLSTVDVNRAPSTKGLMEQKISSLEPFDRWWYQNLVDGEINGLEFQSGWPGDDEATREVGIDKKQFRFAFKSYVKERNISGRVLDDIGIGRELAKICPQAKPRRRASGGVYDLPTLARARSDWEKHLGHKVQWDQAAKGDD